MKNFFAGWYLVYTKPRHEKKVHHRLTEMKITSFLPLTRKLRTWHDRKKYIDEPLFPSYVFVYLEEFQGYYDCIDSQGALYFVKTGKEIARVQESVMKNIRLLIDKGIDLEVSDSSFKPGQELQICKGPLTGLSCEVVQLNSRERLLVRVDLLQRNLLLTLSADALMEV